MTELTASLMGMFGAGTKVAMVLSQIARDIGLDGKEPLIIAREIRSFCTIVRVLSQTMEGLHSKMAWNNYADCSELISDMMVVSKEMFNEVLELIDTIRKSSISGASLPSSAKYIMGTTIRWVLQKPYIIFLRSALEAYKSNLGLLIGSIQLSQSMALSSTCPNSGEAKANMSRLADLQEIANGYQASMQEMETARLAMKDEKTYEPIPWQARLDEMTMAKSTTKNDKQDPRLLEMIAAAQAEVQSLRSSSNVRSNSAASIYSSLSWHSTRVSVILDRLSMDERLQPSERRKLKDMTVRNDHRVQSTPITVPGASQPRIPSQAPVELDSTPIPPGNQPKDEDDWEKAFKELTIKYKNVKRLYFDQKDENALLTRLLNRRLSAPPTYHDKIERMMNANHHRP